MNGLSESVKDELVLRDEPRTLDELIKLSIRLDNRMRERKREKSHRGPAVTSPLNVQFPGAPAKMAPSSYTEVPMQIGRTKQMELLTQLLHLLTLVLCLKYIMFLVKLSVKLKHCHCLHTVPTTAPLSYCLALLFLLDFSTACPVPRGRRWSSTFKSPSLLVLFAYHLLHWGQGFSS